MSCRVGRVVSILFCLSPTPLMVASDMNWEARIQRVSQYYASYYARHYRVPVELVEAIMEVESGWNPQAQSGKGAVGLMQLMPKTAVRFQVKNCYNIEQNIRGGVAYLAQLYLLFHGDLRLVSAAYFTGEGRILMKKLAYASPDTLAYVRQVARTFRQKQRSNQQRELQEESNAAKKSQPVCPRPVGQYCDQPDRCVTDQSS